MSGLKQLTSEAVAAGFCNIDIDSSTLVDLSQPTAVAEQVVNVANTVELTALIRAIEPDGVTISIGGEIGEVGKANSTEEELRAYLDGYFGMLHGSGLPGISKVSIQTGTSHGGVVLPDGSVAQVKIDFDTMQRLSTVARDEYGLAGAVQHGASTLPEEAAIRGDGCRPELERIARADRRRSSADLPRSSPMPRGPFVETPFSTVSSTARRPRSEAGTGMTISRLDPRVTA